MEKKNSIIYKKPTDVRDCKLNYFLIPICNEKKEIFRCQAENTAIALKRSVDIIL